MIMEEPITKIKLEPSNYTKTRNAFLSSCTIPTLKQAKCMLGDFADFVYAECDEGLKHFIKAYHWPRYGDMWISPSDLLISKMILKAPPTKQYMEALTCEGAMQVGWGVEQKFLKYLKEDKQSALENQREKLQIAFDKSIIDQIRDAINREKEACRVEIRYLMDGFDTRLLQELEEITRKLQQEYEVRITEHDELTNRKWEGKIRAAVQETSKNITRQFLEDLERQEQIMANEFKGELVTREIKRRFEIDKQEAEYKMTLQSVKHHLECKNIANMMYILCMERYKCFDEMEALESYHKTKLERLSKKFKVNKEHIGRLKEQIKYQEEQLKIRETCIREILKEYQSFIRIALKGASAHAKFLLSIEKLLLFDLTDTLSKFKSVRYVPQTDLNYIRDDEETIIQTINTSSEWNEIVDETKKEQDSGFVFENKLYIKENFKKFQDLMAEDRGPDSNLWSKEVDLYLQTLKASVQHMKPTDSKLLQLSSTIFAKKDKIVPRKSSFIQFKLSEDSNPCEDLVKVVIDGPPPLMNKMKLDTRTLKYTQPIGTILSPIDYSKLGRLETFPCLLAARSSVELMMEKSAMKANKGPDTAEEEIVEEPRDEGKEVQIKMYVPEHELLSDYERPSLDTQEAKSPVTVMSKQTSQISAKGTSMIHPVDTRDSIILRQSSMAKQQSKKFSISPKDSIEVKNDSIMSTNLKTKSSKLLAAKDSIQLKEVKQVACVFCHQEISAKEQNKDFCCQRCAKKQSQELLADTILRKYRMEQDQQKPIKIAHVEVIETEPEIAPKVVIIPEPTVVESKVFYPAELAKTYKPSKKFKERKRRSYVDPCKQLFKPLTRIEGDASTKEFQQNFNEFTKDRIRSFISLMDEHPNFIKLFTSCQH